MLYQFVHLDYQEVSIETTVVLLRQASMDETFLDWVLWCCCL